MKRNIPQKDPPRMIKAILLLSFCVMYTMVLFYFDESRNSFQGILGKANLASLSIYFIPMVGFTILLYQILKKILIGQVAGIISLFAGPVLGFSIIIGLFTHISLIF